MKLKILSILSLVVFFIFATGIVYDYKRSNCAEGAYIYECTQTHEPVYLHDVNTAECDLCGRRTSLLVEVGNSACFLSHVELENVDTKPEPAGCSVIKSDGYYEIEASAFDSGGGDDQRAKCQASCITWF